MMLVCIGMCVCTMAQNDKVFLHNGTTMEVSVKGISNGVITYSYPGESVTQEVSEKQVEKIVFASGREQQVSEKVIVRDKSDWEKVIITNIESDVAGLVRKGEVKDYPEVEVCRRSNRRQRICIRWAAVPATTRIRRIVRCA